MPSGRGWNDRLADSSVEFFLENVGQHAKVESVEQESQNVFVVHRRRMPDVRVWLCDVYTVGIADYTRIRDADFDIDCIVTISGFNSWTREAKDQGLEDGVGVFKYGQFKGALNYDGDDFVRYEPRDDR